MRRVLLFLSILLVCGNLQAVNITQSLTDATDLSVGDRFQFNILADVALASVVVPDTITNFHVLKVERVTKDAKKAWLRLVIVPLLPGSHSFPRLEVKLTVPDGITHYTDRFRLNIIPVRAAEDTLLVDIKPVEKYPGQIPLWVYLLLFALLLAIFTWLVILNRATPPVKETITDEPESSPMPLPAWKTALAQLDDLIALMLIDQGGYIRHHYELSQIIRKFLESKYRFAALEMTTSEILWVTGRVWVEMSSEAISFLRYCDRVKFAKYTPTREEVESAEIWLRGWLKSFEIMERQSGLAAGGQAAEVR